MVVPSGISYYELTTKGHEYMRKFKESNLHQPFKVFKVWRALRTINLGVNIPGYYKEALRLLPELEKRGLVQRTTKTTEELLDEIPDRRTREVLSVYKRVAEGEKVSDEDIDWLFERSSHLVKFLESKTWTDIPGFKATSKAVATAKTRGDKVIAIDSAMSLVHDAGKVAILEAFGISEDYAPAVNKLLTRLAEE